MRALAARVAVVLALAVVALGGVASVAHAQPKIELEVVEVCKIYTVPILGITIRYDCVTYGTA